MARRPWSSTSRRVGAYGSTGVQSGRRASAGEADNRAQVLTEASDRDAGHEIGGHARVVTYCRARRSGAWCAAAKPLERLLGHESVMNILTRTGERANPMRSEEHTSELQSRLHLVCRLLLEKKKKIMHKRGCHIAKDF